MKRAIGYLRVSTEDQLLGIEAQRKALTDWAARNDAELVEVHTDLGISGAAPLDKRPGLLAAVDALTADAVLVVAKRDRLARDPIVAAMVERLVDRAGARVVSADGVGESDDPAGLLMRRMVDAFAEYERALIRARTSAALQVKRARGEKTGGDVPFGYSAVDGRLVRHEAEQEVIAIARELRAEGLSFRAIGRELDARGIQNRKRTTWFPNQIRRLVAA